MTDLLKPFIIDSKENEDGAILFKKEEDENFLTIHIRDTLGNMFYIRLHKNSEKYPNEIIDAFKKLEIGTLFNSKIVGVSIHSRIYEASSEGYAELQKRLKQNI